MISQPVPLNNIVVDASRLQPSDVVLGIPSWSTEKSDSHAVFGDAEKVEGIQNSLRGRPIISFINGIGAHSAKGVPDVAAEAQV